METGLILAAFSIMTAIIVLLLRGYFNDIKEGQRELKKGQDDLRSYIENNVVTSKTCELQRAACTGGNGGD